MTRSLAAGRLSAAALVVFVASLFVVWSNPDGVTRGPFVGDLREPGMLILSALGFLGASVGTLGARRGLGRAMGAIVGGLGVLNLLAITALIGAAGLAAVREGLALLEVASLLLVVAGVRALVRPGHRTLQHSIPDRLSVA